MAPQAAPFDRQTLEAALAQLGEIAAAEDKVIEISIYGGSAIILSFDFRTSTRDVDAVFEGDREFVRRAAARVAEQYGWNPDWINDGVKGFLSGRDAEPDAKSLLRAYPSEDGAGVRIFIATAPYLFAMKCLAMRIGGAESSQDVEDIRHLGEILDIRTAAEAIAVVSQYYPEKIISPKTRFGLEEMFGNPGST